MATTFNVFYLGNFAEIDTVEGNSLAENAGVLVGETIGSSSDPLFRNIQTFAPGSTGFSGGGSSYYDQDGDPVETFTIDGGPDQTFDAGASYIATITFADGTTAEIIAAIVQDTSGETYLAPQSSANADQAEMEAQPIVSITLDSLHSDTYDGFAADRQVGDYMVGVDGAETGETMGDGYTDAGGSSIGATDDVIYGNGGDDSIDGAGGDDSIYGGAGDDTISTGSGGGTMNWTQVADGDNLNGTSDANYFTVDPDAADTATIRFNNSAGSGDGDGVADYVRIESTDENTLLTIGDFDMGTDKIVLPEMFASYAMSPGSGFYDVTITYSNGNTQNFRLFTDDGFFDVSAVFTTSEPAAPADRDLLSGGDDADTFLIETGFGSDTIIGGEGGTDTDVISDQTGGAVTVTYTGDEAGTLTDGTDTLTFSEIEQIELNNAADSVDASADSAGISVDAGGGADTVIGGSGDDTIRSGADDDYVNTGAGNDSLEAGGGNDTLIGGADDDIFRIQDTDGTVTIDGGTGTDTIDFDNTGAAGVSITQTGFGPGTFSFAGGSSGNFTGVEAFELSDADDTVNASAHSSDMTVTDGAGGGDDSITTGSGDDVISAGAGRDTIEAGDGDDTVEGGGGADSIDGGAGDDMLSGDGPRPIVLLNFQDGASSTATDESGFGNDGTYTGDAASGGSGWTGAGSDTALILDGSGDYVEIPHDPAFDLAEGTVSIRFNADTLSSGDALFSRDSSYFDGGGHLRAVLGSDGRVEVRLQSDSASYTVKTDPGLISTGQWHHVAVSFGPEGLQVFVDGDLAASNSYTGGIKGNSEPWTIGADQWQSGDSVADNLKGHFDGAIDEFAVFDSQLNTRDIGSINKSGISASPPGADTISGGDGDDTISGGDGDDQLSGDGGDDTFIVEDGFGSDTITGGETSETQGDVLDLSNLSSPVTVKYTGDEAGTITDGTDTLSFAEFERIIMTDQSDKLDGSADSAGMVVDGGGGNDVMQGGSGNDSLSGGAGNDRIDGGTGFDTLDGGDGNDTIDLEDNDGTATVFGGDGFDELDLDDSTGNGFSVTLDGDNSGTAAGGTLAVTFSEIERIETSNQDDTVDASLDSSGLEIGTEGGNDSVIGGSGGDTIDGGDGDDTIDGGSGNDSIDGGDGSDSILVADGFGNDTILGGEGGTDDDTIDLSGLTGPVTVTYTGDEAGTITDGTDTITFSEIERIIGTDHDDRFDLNENAADISAGDGNDTIVDVTDGTIDAGDGDDLIEVDHGSGSADITGGTGTDTLRLDSDDAEGVKLTLTSHEDGSYNWATAGDGTFTSIDYYDLSENDDTIDGSSATTGFGAEGDGGNDSIVGGSGDDTLRGGSDNDTLDGGAGDDSLEGGSGDDVFYGDSVSSISFALGGTSRAGVNPEFEVFADGVLIYTGEVTWAQNAPFDANAPGAFQVVEIPVSGGLPDSVKIVYTNDSDPGDGSPGGDRNLHVDNLTVGDTTYEAETDATANGGTNAGNNYNLFGTPNSLTFNTSTAQNSGGNDTMSGGDGADTFHIEDDFGNDVIIGGEGGTDDDVIDLSALSGPVTVTYTGDEAGTITDGTDTISFSEIERIVLTDQNDSLNASLDSAGTEIRAGGGADTIVGGQGDDTVYGENGNDSINLGEGNDFSQGDGGNDTIDGGDGNDTIRGSGGNDSVYGGAGNDGLTGGSGRDTLDGGSGNDNLNGQNDEDTFVFSDGFGNDTVIGGEGGVDDDVIDLSALSGPVTVTYTGDEAGTITDGTDTISFSEIERVILTDEADVVDATADTAGTDIDAGGGNDFIETGSGDDAIVGGTGNDTIFYGDGNNTVFGGDGDDLIDDEAGNPGYTGANYVDAGSGNDTVYSGYGDDSIDGGDGDDNLFGQWGDDTIDGGMGGDTIHGGIGNDSLTGGDDDDVFVFTDGAGRDTISDFDMGDHDANGNFNDQLDLSGITRPDGTPINAWDIVVSDDGSGNALLTFPRGDQLVLQGVAPAQMSSASQLHAAGVPCFTAGTGIATPNGYRPVETLRPGDLIETRDHGPQEILWVAQTTVPRDALRANERLQPLCIPIGALGNPAPVLVSRQHCFVMGEVFGFASEHLVRAVHLLRSGLAEVAAETEAVTYIHILCQRHEVVFIDGDIATETFYPGPVGLKKLDPRALARLRELFPTAGDAPSDAVFGPRARPLANFRDLKQALRRASLSDDYIAAAAMHAARSATSKAGSVRSITSTTP